MRKPPTARILLPTLALAVGAAAQQPGYIDPLPVLQAVSREMGVDKLKCVSFSGEGYAGMVGQNITQNTDWPRGEPLADYTRTIDYEAESSVETFERKPGLNPRSWKYGTGWRGGTPLQKHRKQTFVVAGKHAWHIDGENSPPIPAPGDAELWRLDIRLNPHGFVRAAMMDGANPKAIWRWEMAESGRDGATTSKIEKSIVLSATVLGRYRVNATINDRNLIQRLQPGSPIPSSAT